jgi:hypothetical protein
MSLKPQNRWQAFALHMLISLLIFVALVAVIYFFWYPGFLFRYDGGLEGAKLVAGVDFVIGPSLTLLVYKLGKKSLTFDLACIAVLQIACISGGMWAVWRTRPVAVVFAAGTYATVNQHAYEALGYQPKKIAILQDHWPVWVAVKLPEGREAGISMVWALTGQNLHASVDNYVPYADMVPLLGRQGLQATDIKNGKGQLGEFQKAHANSKFFPVTTSMYAGYLAIDTDTGKVLEYFEESE